MRTLQQKPKVLMQVEIPPDLRAFLKEVAADNTSKLELWACTDDNCGSMFPNSGWSCGYCDYIDDDPPKLPTGEFRSRRDWALAYFALNPDAHPLQMIGAYNGNEQRDDSLGFFSLQEAMEIQSAFQSGERRKN